MYANGSYTFYYNLYGSYLIKFTLDNSSEQFSQSIDISHGDIRYNKTVENALKFWRIRSNEVIDLE